MVSVNMTKTGLYLNRQIPHNPLRILTNCIFSMMRHAVLGYLNDRDNLFGKYPDKQIRIMNVDIFKIVFCI